MNDAKKTKPPETKDLMPKRTRGGAATRTGVKAGFNFKVEIELWEAPTL